MSDSSAFERNRSAARQSRASIASISSNCAMLSLGLKGESRVRIGPLKTQAGATGGWSQQPRANAEKNCAHLGYDYKACSGRWMLKAMPAGRVVHRLHRIFELGTSGYNRQLLESQGIGAKPTQDKELISKTTTISAIATNHLLSGHEIFS